MLIGIPRETQAEENRVAIIPAGVPELLEAGYEVLVEKNAGEGAHFSDEEYRSSGAIIADDAEALNRQANIIVKVQAPDADEAKLIKDESTLICILEPWDRIELIRDLAARSINSYALDLVPRTTRAQSMDVLSAMAGISGYRSVLRGAMSLPRYFPMLMTAAGTIHLARVLIIGAGVAGLMAIATARRLGAVVEAYDLRPEVKEQVESLGAEFIEIQVAEEENTEQASDSNGYANARSSAFYEAQRQQLGDCVARADLVITTAAVPGKPAPKLIDKEMMHRMKRGSVIVDLAAARGGNVEGTVLNQKIDLDGITLVGHVNHPSRVPVHASQLLNRNIINFIQNMTSDGRLVPNQEDDIVAATQVTSNGGIYFEPAKEENETEPDNQS